MKSNIFLYCIIVILLVTGCLIPSGVVDRIPKDVPKAYVEFYYLLSDGIKGESFIIYSMDLQQEYKDLEYVREGQVSSFMTKGTYLRLAKTPGIYKFRIKYYPLSNKLYPPIEYKDMWIKLEEGMVTIVRIEYSNVSQGYSLLSYNRNIYIEKTIPIAYHVLHFNKNKPR